MKCRACESTRHAVLSTRHGDMQVRRTRECLDCGHRWTTVELYADSATTMERAKEFVMNIAALAKEMNDG